MRRHTLKLGEAYAIKSSAIERDSDGFFLIVGDAPPENETRGTVAIVHVRGALSQFKSDGGDSYEGIVERVCRAFASDPKPTAVVLCISSPGGIVAGLNEAVFRLQRESREHKIPLIAYVNELAASAAYALCCACSEVLAPPSAIVGSVGTISTMVSQARRDRAEGLDFAIITSGKRKSDGHPHVPITDEAVKAEQRRNAALAEQFFALVAKARKVSAAHLESLEAAIFLGTKAVKAGLVDGLASLDDVLLGLDRSEAPPPEPAPNDGNVTDRRAKELDSPAQRGPTLTQEAQPGPEAQAGTREVHMPVKLDALIRKTEAAISTETDPKKLRSLQANLSAFLATRAEMDDDDGDDKHKDPDGDEDDDDKAKKAEEKARKAKRAEEKAKLKSKRADEAAKYAKRMHELDEEEKKFEEDDDEKAQGEEERKARAAATLSPGAAAALVSQSSITTDALTRIQRLEKSAEFRELTAMIEEARATRRITPGEAKTLAKKPAAFVRDFLEMRPKALVATDEDALDEPDRTAAGDIPAFAKQIVESDIKMKGLEGDAAKKYRDESYAAHRAAQAGANGAGVY